MVKKRIVSYTDRDFTSIKSALVDYAKRYYGDSYKDFNEASFGSLMLDTVAYVGVQYDLSTPQGIAVYRLVKSGYTWTPSQDMGPTGTVVGYQIVATIRDLALSVTGDTIFATGTDAGVNHPIVYFKDLSSTGLWEAMTTTGFPFVSGKKGRAIAVGVDTLYCAVDNEVYFHQYGSLYWVLGYDYPMGTEINFLFYDDLLVGTSTGLYGHVGGPPIINIEEIDMSREHLAELTGGMTVPQIVVNGTNIGGFDKLMMLSQSGELERLLNA